jgi:hypothetical protein
MDIKEPVKNSSGDTAKGGEELALIIKQTPTGQGKDLEIIVKGKEKALRELICKVFTKKPEVFYLLWQASRAFEASIMSSEAHHRGEEEEAVAIIKKDAKACAEKMFVFMNFFKRCSK